MKIVLFFVALLTVSSVVFAQNTIKDLIVGTYTNTGVAKGIYTYRLNSSNGMATKMEELDAINPSFLAVSADKKFVYAVNENGKNSTVSAFKFDAKTNKLKFINRVASFGTDPCYITVDQKHVFVSNYSSGSLAVFNRNVNGSLTDAVQIIQHTGSSIDLKGRQKSAHVHMGIFSPDKKYLIVVDLGEDKVYTYTYHPDAKNDILKPYATYNTTPGSGPRHIVFSKDGKFAYLVHEFNGKIDVLAYADGKFNKMEEHVTTRENFDGAIDGAEIAISADGKFIYESNRGDANTISVFSISADGTLKLVEIVNSLGKGPRSFTIDPSGKYLLVGHQYTKEIVIFKRHGATGKLTDTGNRIDLGAAVCLLFAAK